jgi:CheY-like chemotaxis protein
MSDRPLLLLLDDQAEARESMRGLFESINCSVIAVATHASALDEISSRTDIDFVVTDLNLRSDSSDKSGIIFAKMVKQFREDIPVAAYSAKTKEMMLSPHDYRVFDLFLDKANGTDEITRFVNECKGLALTHKKMAASVVGKLASASGPDLQELRDRVTRIEQTYFRLPNIEPYARGIYIFVGLLGALASIWGLYVVLR